MTIKVKYHNGVFKLRSIIGLFNDLSEEEVHKFEEAAKRPPLFENR